jgi:hypothetical protein
MKKSNVTTIILPDGEKIYAEKVAVVGLNVGHNGPPEEGKCAFTLCGNFDMEDMPQIDQIFHKGMKQAHNDMMKNALKQASQDVPGFDELADELFDRLAKDFAKKVAGNPEILKALLKK